MQVHNSMLIAELSMHGYTCMSKRIHVTVYFFSTFCDGVYSHLLSLSFLPSLYSRTPSDLLCYGVVSYDADIPSMVQSVECSN